MVYTLLLPQLPIYLHAATMYCSMDVHTLFFQILQAGSHHVSYVLVRGSVPVFWTQPGIKYRPPPVIERGVVSTCLDSCELGVCIQMRRRHKRLSRSTLTGKSPSMAVWSVLIDAASLTEHYVLSS